MFTYTFCGFTFHLETVKTLYHGLQGPILFGLSQFLVPHFYLPSIVTIPIMAYLIVICSTSYQQNFYFLWTSGDGAR